MSALVPAPLHRFALKAAHRLRLAWWGWRKPELHGCNAIVANAAGEVLLVRHSYQAPGRWMLPGGGLRRGERAVDAAVRELLEETGCRLRECVPVGVDVVAVRGARNNVHLVAARTDDAPVADGREIVEARFFPRNALPDAITSTAHARIARSAQNRAS
ncbi:MAG TPA: NUDIX domain-containing protein [Novosphingobium sp.]|nr:NUDIX domain-containing protein [Novosphingobium sp.]